jgi:hypothetical protein
MSYGDDLMNTQTAIMALVQSEKIKSGLIWVSQALELLANLSEKHKPGAERISRSFMNFILFEVHIAKQAAPEAAWEEIEKNIDLAIIMTNSGVPAESVYHLTRALSHVTNIGQRSMLYLKKKGLLK